MTLADVDIWQTILALSGGGLSLASLVAGVRWAVKRAGAAGWEIGLWVARVDLAKLRDEATKGRAASARADAIVRAAEARAAASDAAAKHACEQCATITRERDELALRIAHHRAPEPAHKGNQE